MKLTTMKTYVNLNLFQVRIKMGNQYDEILKQVQNDGLVTNLE